MLTKPSGHEKKTPQKPTEDQTSVWAEFRQSQAPKTNELGSGSTNQDQDCKYQLFWQLFIQAPSGATTML
jgi:hypothetical protein